MTQEGTLKTIERRVINTIGADNGGRFVLFRHIWDAEREGRLLPSYMVARICPKCGMHTIGIEKVMYCYDGGRMYPLDSVNLAREIGVGTVSIDIEKDPYSGHDFDFLIGLKAFPPRTQIEKDILNLTLATNHLLYTTFANG